MNNWEIIIWISHFAYYFKKNSLKDTDIKIYKFQLIKLKNNSINSHLMWIKLIPYLFPIQYSMQSLVKDSLKNQAYAS